MLLKNLTTEQMWAYVREDEERLAEQVVCNGCGSKENMACILTLSPHRNKCFECDTDYLDRELEGWC